MKCDRRPQTAAAKDLFLHMADESALIMGHPSTLSSAIE